MWLADRPIAGSAQAIEHLDSAGQRILFVTNFSALTKRQAEMKLEACGIDAQDRVLTSAMGLLGFPAIVACVFPAAATAAVSDPLPGSKPFGVG